MRGAQYMHPDHVIYNIIQVDCSSGKKHTTKQQKRQRQRHLAGVQCSIHLNNVFLYYV